MICIMYQCTLFSTDFFFFYMTFNSTMGGGDLGEVTHIVTCTPYATPTFWKALYLMILASVQWHHICNLCLFSFSICRDFLSYMICRTLNKDWKVISPVISCLTQGSLFQCYYFFFQIFHVFTVCILQIISYSTTELDDLHTLFAYST